MTIKLPPDVLKGLPDPSSDDGLVRVNVGLKLGADGEAQLVEMNDTPLPAGADDSGEEEPPAEPDTSEAAEMDNYSASASEQLAAL